MSWPTPVGAIVNSLEVVPDRFPFIWWASGAKFDYPEGAKHLFCKCGSAAESFFLLPFVTRVGTQFLPDRAAYGDIEVIPQRKVHGYFLDFAVHDGSTRIAVEVDGLQYHHRTSDQIESDYLRSRRLIAAGYTVVRYTAAEVFRDATECWRQLDAILDSRLPARSRPA